MRIFILMRDDHRMVHIASLLARMVLACINISFPRVQISAVYIARFTKLAQSFKPVPHVHKNINTFLTDSSFPKDI